MEIGNHVMDLVRFSDLAAIALLMGWEKRPVSNGNAYCYLLTRGTSTLRFRKTNFGSFTMVWGYMERRTVLEQSLTKEKLKELTGIDLCEVI